MKTGQSFILILVLLFFISGCGDDEEVNYLVLDGVTSSLKTGIIQDDGTDYELTKRIYRLEFKDFYEPSCYIRFELYSTRTDRLAEGVYEYSFDELDAGNVSFLNFAQKLTYDNLGVVISGRRYRDDNLDITGTVTVGKNGSIYTFDFNFSAIDGHNNAISLTGHFEDVLEEGFVHFDK